MKIHSIEAKSILTRTGGYLAGIASHSLQPYRGCAFGRSLCGVGCYARHNPWLTRGEEWGSFLEARANAAELYRVQFDRERAWARRRTGQFGIFLSSSTEPFPPQEERLGISRAVLEAMLALPPDRLIVQTHSHHVARHAALLLRMAERCDLRVHVSIETDRERIVDLPGHASSIEGRLAAAQTMRDAGLRVIVTVAPLLPIAEPEVFFARLGEVADGVVIDHFVGGDGTADGSRTARTRLPMVMESLEAGSTTLAYRDEMVQVARRILPGRVGVGARGFFGELS